MNRLIVALLAAFDALLAAAGGLALALAPLTLLWVFGFGAGADWGALWPVSATLWQFGHLVPVSVALPEQYLAVAGIDPLAATFVLSLAPLAFAVFTAVFAARSGGRAAAAGDPVAGVVSGIVVFLAVSTATALTGAPGAVVSVETWQAIVLPTVVYAAPALVGAAVGAWVHDVAPLSFLRRRAERWSGAWSSVPGLVVRGTGLAIAGLVGCGALLLGVTVIVRGPQIVALFQAGNVDVLGAVVLAFSQLLYLPTLVVWAVSFVAGPGFALGEGGAVSPAGTQTGVLPGIPVLGLVPDSTSPWLLLLALLPVAVGVGTGWVLRARLAANGRDEDVAPRLVVTLAVSVLTAGLAALAAACATGSIGPGRLAVLGPEPGAVALAVGIEVAVGIAILLLSPRRQNHDVRPELGPYAADVPAVAARPGSPDTGLFAALTRFDDDHPVATENDPGVHGRRKDNEQDSSENEAVPVAADEEAAASIDDTAPLDDAVPPVSADEQETAPIVGFERGSGHRPPAGKASDTSVD